MSNFKTWVVLGDGRYIRIFERPGPGQDLVTLRSGDFEALAKLTYEIITRMLPPGVTGPAQARDYSQLLADFLQEQHDLGRYDRLVIAAPEAVLNDLHAVLSEQVKELIIAEHSADLLSRSIHEIEVLLGEMSIKGD